MSKFFNEYKSELAIYINENTKVRNSKKITYRAISVLLALFFVSAPVAILINLYIFEDYYYLISLGLSILFSLLLVLQEQFYYSMIRRITNNFKIKYMSIYNICESFVFGIVLFIILVILSNVFI